MAFNRDIDPDHTRLIRAIAWAIALFVMVYFSYRIFFGQALMKRDNCMEDFAAASNSAKPLASIDKFSACIARRESDPSKSPPRCRYAGSWTSQRGNMTYQITLEADGKFVAEPDQNAPSNAETVTGAWGVAGKSMVWAYDSGMAWPPDINRISDDTKSAFTLREVNGELTRFTLVKRQGGGLCPP